MRRATTKPYPLLCSCAVEPFALLSVRTSVLRYDHVVVRVNKKQRSDPPGKSFESAAAVSISQKEKQRFCLKTERFSLNKGTLTSPKQGHTEPWSLKLNRRKKEIISEAADPSQGAAAHHCYLNLSVRDLGEEHWWEKVQKQKRRRRKNGAELFTMINCLRGTFRGSVGDVYARSCIACDGSCVRTHVLQSEFMGKSQALTQLGIYQESRQQCSHCRLLQSTHCDLVTSILRGRIKVLILFVHLAEDATGL